MSAITRCLELEAAAIASAARRLDQQDVERALGFLESCFLNRQKLIISGVGKSGIVGRKIAATFSSIGLMSVYLSPLDALHGDIGIVAEGDLVFLLSNSGETEELLAMIPHFRRRKNPILALVGRVNSTLAKQADITLDGSVDREICPLNLAPTASTALAMAIGDALAAVWMERIGISSIDFAMNHPSGSLGKSLTLTVFDLMIDLEKNPPLSKKAGLNKIIEAITKGGFGACCISEESRPSKVDGIITDGDLRRTLQETPEEQWCLLTAQDLMTSNPVTVFQDCLALNALKIMECNSKKEISLLPVLDPDENLVGLVRLHDLVQAGLK